MSEFFKTDRALAVALGIIGIVIGWLFSLMVGTMRDLSEEQTHLIKKVEGLASDVDWLTDIAKTTEARQSQDRVKRVER